MNDWLSIAMKNIKDLNHSSLTELDVQRLIIEPLLQWLDYNTFDFLIVQEQTTIDLGGPKAGKGRADYTIYNEHKPLMIIEAKSLTESLDDPRTLKQLLTYCTFHKDKPRWGVLTNGQYWHIYDNEATGSPFERCVLKIDILEDISALYCLQFENLPFLVQYADVLQSLHSIPEKSKQYMLNLAREDFLNNLSKNKNDNSSKKSTHQEQQTITNEIKSDDQLKTSEQSSIQRPQTALAWFNHRPTQGLSPSAIVINDHRQTKNLLPSAIVIKSKNIPCTSWSSIATTFVKHLLQNIERPTELDGWSVTQGNTVTISSNKSQLLRPKDIGFGLFLNTNYNATYIIRIIDKLISKYNWKESCYWVE